MAKDSFPIRLREARLMMRLSMEQLAKLTGDIITKQSISRYEKGIMHPKRDAQRALAQALNISEEYFKEDNLKNEARNNPENLMKWLYENQSPRLFGAENRLFVVLVDSTDMNQSWKMKRAFSLIEPKVNTYLDSFSENSLKKIEFTFNKKCTKVLPT